MDKLFSMAEVCRMTGLAAHTIRFYETQFPKSLVAERTAGGHRKYRQAHIDVLTRILSLSRGEGKSLREVREQLGEEEVSNLRDSGSTQSTGSGTSVDQTLTLVLENLKELNARNDRLDRLVNILLAETGTIDRGTALSQIDAIRRETRVVLNDSHRSLIELGMNDLLRNTVEPDGHEH